MTPARVLIVDDEPDLRELLALTLQRMQLESCGAASVEEAKDWLKRQNFQLCLTDMRLPDGSGIELVRHIQQQFPQLPVAVITAYGSMDSAVEALKAGAFDFVSKPVNLQVLRNLVANSLKLESVASNPTRPAAPGAQLLLGESTAMTQIRALIGKIARSQAPIHISGESGTGKELAARLIHAQSARAEGPFIAVNCGAIPPELVESEFFGHKRGTFTGATGDKEGLFQAAQSGTLFLDEVADLPLAMQVKLLRAIQEKSVRPIGATREVPVDVRLLSATHKDLSTLVTGGEFRQDLFYRLNVINVHMPPLRERREDVPMLASALLTRLATRHKLSGVPRLSPRAMQALSAHSFPGNVRELENLLERALAIHEQGLIEVTDLNLPAAPSVVAAEIPTSVATSTLPLEAQLEAMERQLILRALEETRWNRAEAAKRLGVTYRSFRHRLQKLGLD